MANFYAVPPRNRQSTTGTLEQVLIRVDIEDRLLLVVPHTNIKPLAALSAKRGQEQRVREATSPLSEKKLWNERDDVECPPPMSIKRIAKLAQSSGTSVTSEPFSKYISNNTILQPDTEKLEAVQKFEHIFPGVLCSATRLFTKLYRSRYKAKQLFFKMCRSCAIRITQRHRRDILEIPNDHF
ncbi:MAG: hypothetical protein HOM44_04375 [Gammaproteobacteria bacterium]|nr:hypothetical protein [Gammaproteobacteria bacterium]MBT5684788.1 hypothetical protein [Gammaproteobacteria bacterium]MBT5792870.1 hypothetical protein [Gammaproteobacteria bacterium]MBT7880102.1 hypothetical protein [Gammaproteobacteria bacterium]